MLSQINDAMITCETCIQVKSHRAFFPLSMNKSNTIPFSLIHFDVWGLAPWFDELGIKWFVTFIDDFTRMTWLYMIKHKIEVFKIFQVFHRIVQTQFSAKIQVLRSYNGGEYVNQEFRHYFQEYGLQHETSCPYPRNNQSSIN